MWTSIIKDLQEAGLTQVEIAEAINSSQATVSLLAAQKIADPSWLKGQALLRLHAERCGTPQPATTT